MPQGPLRGQDRIDEVATILGPGNWRQLAYKTGYGPSHVTRALKGETRLSLESAAKIAFCAGVTLDELWEFIPKHRYQTGERKDPGQPSRRDKERASLKARRASKRIIETDVRG